MKPSQFSISVQDTTSLITGIAVDNDVVSFHTDNRDGLSYILTQVMKASPGCDVSGNHYMAKSAVRLLTGQLLEPNVVKLQTCGVVTPSILKEIVGVILDKAHNSEAIQNYLAGNDAHPCIKMIRESTEMTGSQPLIDFMKGFAESANPVPPTNQPVLTADEGKRVVDAFEKSFNGEKLGAATPPAPAKNNNEFNVTSIGIQAGQAMLVSFLYAMLLSLAKQGIVSAGMSKRNAHYLSSALQFALIALLADSPVTVFTAAVLMVATSDMSDEKRWQFMHAAQIGMAVTRFSFLNVDLESTVSKYVVSTASACAATAGFVAMDAINARFFSRPAVVRAPQVAEEVAVERRP